MSLTKALVLMTVTVGLVAGGPGLGNAQDNDVVRYVAVGDSYSTGRVEGQETDWPEVLSRRFQEAGISLQLVVNAAEPAATTLEAIQTQLAAVANANPEFVTVLIGARDVLGNIGPETFRFRLKILYSQILKSLPGEDPKKLLILTIPDFSLMPRAGEYDTDLNTLSERIASFNEVIREEAELRQLPLVDLAPLSAEISRDPDLVAEDGVHPSAQGYQLWVNTIFPRVKELLTGK